VWHVLVTWDKIPIGSAVTATIRAFVLAYVFGCLAGALLALAVWATKGLVSAWLESLVALLYNIPRIVLIPIFILWFGLAGANAALFGAVSVAFVVFYHVLAGFRAAPSRLTDGVKVLGGRRRDQIRWVVVPAARPLIFTGLLIAVPQALVGVIAAEMLIGAGGLGGLVEHLSGQYNSAGVFAVAVIACLLGIALNIIVRAVSRFTKLDQVSRGVAGVG
jgi:NitT/TauT family transport system permease protein